MVGAMRAAKPHPDHERNPMLAPQVVARVEPGWLVFQCGHRRPWHFEAKRNDLHTCLDCARTPQ